MERNERKKYIEEKWETEKDEREKNRKSTLKRKEISEKKQDIDSNNRISDKVESLDTIKKKEENKKLRESYKSG